MLCYFILFQNINQRFWGGNSEEANFHRRPYTFEIFILETIANQSIFKIQFPMPRTCVFIFKKTNKITVLLPT